MSQPTHKHAKYKNQVSIFFLKQTHNGILSLIGTGQKNYKMKNIGTVLSTVPVIADISIKAVKNIVPVLCFLTLYLNSRHISALF
jgi:hypothetical protein